MPHGNPDEHRRNLERQVRQDNRAARRSRASLEKKSEQLRALAAELIQAEQRERRRIASVLHDHLQQLLVLAKIKTSQIEDLTSEPGVARLATEIDAVLDDLIEASRTLTVQLSPPVLHESGLSDALHWLGKQLRVKHGLEVSVRTSVDAEPASESTRVFLFNAISELLFNVVKHAKESRAAVEMTRTHDDQVRVVVSDDGPGFDPAILQGRSTSGGFGLFKIRERVEVLGGSLKIESRVEEGTRLTIQAPITEVNTAHLEEPIELEDGSVLAVDPELAQATLSEPGGSDEIQVLLADDHEILRQGLATLLEECPDIRVVGQASNGRIAVRLARSTRPDVVLMDVDMPDTNGIEATLQICHENPDVKVLGLSMHRDDHIHERMIDAGAADCLTKGSPTHKLIARIRSLARPITDEPHLED